MLTVIKKISIVGLLAMFIVTPFDVTGYSNPVIPSNTASCGVTNPTVKGTPITCSIQTLGTNRLLIVDIQQFNTGISAITYNGVAMTRLRITTNTVSNSRYYLVNPAIGVNTLSVTPAVSGGQLSIGYVALSNVDQVNWYDVESGNTTRTITLTTRVPNTRIIAHYTAGLSAACDGRLSGYPNEFLYCQSNAFTIASIGRTTYAGTYSLTNFTSDAFFQSINGTAIRPAIPNTYPIITNTDNSIMY